MNSTQNISKTTLDFETKLKLKSLGPARPQLKIVQVQNECKYKKAYTRRRGELTSSTKL